MNEELRDYFDRIFKTAPKTKAAFNLKEELLANAIERYYDLLADGVNSEDAYKNVIQSIGDVSELFEGLEEINMENSFLIETQMKKLAMYKAIAVGLYVFSVVVFFLFALLDDFFMFSNLDFSTIGLVAMLLIAIIPTGMFVYLSNAYPNYQKKEDTVVEEFKEWKNEAQKRKAIRNAMSSLLWTVTVTLYLGISFFTGAWHITWLIFLIATCAQTILELYFKLKE